VRKRVGTRGDRIEIRKNAITNQRKWIVNDGGPGGGGYTVFWFPVELVTHNYFRPVRGKRQYIEQVYIRELETAAHSERLVGV
jgi:hypothetical protein